MSWPLSSVSGSAPEPEQRKTSIAGYIVEGATGHTSIDSERGSVRSVHNTEPDLQEAEQGPRKVKTAVGLSHPVAWTAVSWTEGQGHPDVHHRR